MPGSTPPSPIAQAVSLDRLAGMTPERRAAVKDQWITTVQDLLGVADVPGGRDYLKSALGMNDAAVDDLLLRGRQMAPRAGDAGQRLLDEAMQIDFDTGVVEPTPTMRAGEVYDTIALAGELPAFVSHVDRMPPTRNQAGRGTCVAHAAAAVREFLEIQAGTADPSEINLSEQFIYWWCKENDNLPNVGGTYPHKGLECMEKIGAATETIWPYNPRARTGDEGQGPPPQEALAAAWQYKLKRVIKLDPHDTKSIRAAIADGRAVLFAIPVFASWYRNAVAKRHGKLIMPLPGERPNGAHAMALVGYVDDVEAPGGGYFLLRNSWAPWGFDCPSGASYGAIPYAFLEKHNMAAVTGDRASVADVYIRDNEADDGHVPTEGIRCNSPDIWVRHAADDQSDHQMARGGEENTIYVRAWNLGPGEAKAVVAKLFAAELSPSIWPQNWQEIGEAHFPPIPAKGSAIASLTWTPADKGPFCFLARLSSPDDPVQHDWSVRNDNNLAQKNLLVLQIKPGERTEFTFAMHGLPNRLTLLDLDVDRRAFKRGRIELRMAERPNVAAAPGEFVGGAVRNVFRLDEDETKLADLAVHGSDKTQVTVAITADAKSRPGETGEVVFTQRYGRLLVGRVVVRIEIV